MTQRVKGIVVAIPEGAEAANLCAALLFAHANIRREAQLCADAKDASGCSVRLRHASLIYDLAEKFL